MTLHRPLAALALACALTLTPHATRASGGDGFTDNAFVPLHHVPAPELAAFAGGRLGVLDPGHWRIYHVLAWRALHSLPLPAAELKALNLNEWRVGPEGAGWDQGSQPERNGVATWLAARDSVAPPLADKARPGVELMTPHYVSYVNCPVDAFERAAATLRARVQQHGAPATLPWIAAQDAVFANCSPQQLRSGNGWVAPPPTLPPALPANAPAWLAQDLAYQGAAALFYAGRHEEARSRFLAIAADKRSPWQPLGAYLAARCLLRQATLMPVPESSSDSLAAPARPLLETARRELGALAATDPAAARLLGWVDARLRPAERAAELARALQTGTLAGAERVRQLSDYLRLMDTVDEHHGLADAAEPMTAWIGLMQAADPAGSNDKRNAPLREQVRTRWQQDHDIAWLLPLATMATRLADLQPDELKAMRAVPATSPAWQTLNWQLARLALASANAAESDAAIDAALAGAGGPLAPSTRNRWLQLKLASARSVEAFLAAAPRAVAEPEAPAAVPIPDEAHARPAPTGIDDDFTQRLYRHLPLARLAALDARADFPAALRTSHAEIVFTRALLLEDWAGADKLAGTMAASRATTRHLYQRLLAATKPQDKRLAAALILVNTPEFSPQTVTAHGSLRYWGCRAYDGDAAPGALLSLAPQFLSAAERATAEQERTRLEALPVRTRWLAGALLDWAATKPDDPEAPKALHFLVASTRLECDGGAPPAAAGAPNHSRQAFELLHKLWPRSEWAAKTKYWYGS